METEERFWSKVDKSSGDCWLSTGGRDKEGYGVFMVSQSKNAMAHRYAFEIENGPIPSGKRLLPDCGIKLCVRPSHMRLTTVSELKLKAYQEGLINVPRGEDHYNASLTEDQIREIIRRHEECGVSYLDLARENGRTKSAIGGILQRRSWKHLEL